jgi:hypothetical protein
MFEQARAISEAAGDRANADLARQGIAFCYASMGQHAPAPTTSYGDGYGRCGCFRVHLRVCVLRDCMCIEGPRMQCARVSILHPVLFNFNKGNQISMGILESPCAHLP